MSTDLIERAKAAYSMVINNGAGTWAVRGCTEMYAVLPELVAEVERLHSWDGLMSLVDEHYPADIFPTEPDHKDRDPGPRIISLLRRLDSVQRLRMDCSEHIDAIRDERDELLCRVDELADENAELRRQLPDYEVTR